MSVRDRYVISSPIFWSRTWSTFTTGVFRSLVAVVALVGIVVAGATFGVEIAAFGAGVPASEPAAVAAVVVVACGSARHAARSEQRRASVADSSTAGARLAPRHVLGEQAGLDSEPSM